MKRLLLFAASLLMACDDTIPGLCKTDRDCRPSAAGQNICYEGVCASADILTDGGGTPLADGGATDTGRQDVDLGDGGSSDSGSSDGGSSDGGARPTDAGFEDSAPKDAGVMDASDGGGFSDAGPPDAGTCIGSTCCEGAFLACGSSNRCASWDFETGSATDWALDTSAPFGNGGLNAVATTTRAHGGSIWSLAIPASAPPVAIKAQLCPDGNGVNLSGFKVSMWIYLDGTAYPRSDKSAFYTWGSQGIVDGSNAFIGTGSLSTSTWIQLKGTFYNTSVTTAFGLLLAPSPPDFNGTIYIDDVRLMPP